MTAIEFRAGVMDWLRKYNFTNVESISCHIYSGYMIKNHEIRIGIEAIENVDVWFEEFLIERGLEWEHVPSPVLQFLHELGHNQTIYEYTDDQLLMCSLLKDFIGDSDECKENAIKYWKIMDELAANDWLVDFANNEIEAISELCQFFIDNWEDSVQSMKEEAWNNL